MQQVERGTIGLDDPVIAHVAEWRDEIALTSLFGSAVAQPGLPAYRELFPQPPRTPRFRSGDLQRAARVRTTHPIGLQRSRVHLLGFLLDEEIPLSIRFETMLGQMCIVEDLQFNPPVTWLRRIAPTEHDTFRGRLIVGEVHDENAWALGGTRDMQVSSERPRPSARMRATCFSARRTNGAFTRDTLESFIARRTDVPGSSRALGWDTMLPTSSCGSRMSSRHLAIPDTPGRHLDRSGPRVYVVLLTNACIQRARTTRSKTCGPHFTMR
jgi:hypothetical protein